MKKLNSVCWQLVGFSCLYLLMNTTAVAHDRVAVIPLNIARKTTCTAPDEVVSQANRCWKDRNLGAAKVATDFSDSAAFGDLYQWGRQGDGHQNRNSSPLDSPSSYDDPGHSSFITVDNLEDDWRTPKNDILWQGIGGVNNPCPQGFRLPTAAEFEAEREAWVSQDTIGALASPLRLPPAGARINTTGSINASGEVGLYWTSTVSGNMVSAIIISNSPAILDAPRSYGSSVRCIKD